MIKLKDYQIDGVNFLISNKFAILADEAGLGKTHQACAAAKLAGCSVGVFAPLSTLKQWQNHLEQHGCEVLFCLTNSDSSVDKCTKDGVYPNLLIFDEIHKKAGNTKFSQKVISYVRCGAGKRFIWGLSASPVRDGKIINAWLIYALLKLSIKNEIPKYSEFETRYAEWEQVKFSQYSKAKKWIANKNEIVFYNGVKPHILQRVYDDVGKTQQVEFTQISAPRFDVIEAFIANSLENNENVIEEVDKLLNLSVAEILVKLRVLAAQNSTETTIKALQNHNDSVIVFSSFIEPLKTIQKELEKQCVASVLVYGGVVKKQRDLSYQQFRDGEVSVLLATYGTTSTGVDYPEKDSIIFNDLPYEATELHQAIMRIVRMNSSKSSLNKSFEFVYSNNFIDDFILATLSKKYHNLINFVKTPSLKNIPKLSPDDTTKLLVFLIKAAFDSCLHRNVQENLDLNSYYEDCEDYDY